MSFPKDDLMQYRLQRANESFLSAKLNYENGLYNSAVNRLYYACFYIILAFFVKYDIHSSTHSGVKNMFNKHLILSKKLPQESGKFFNQLFGMRNTGDYDDYTIFEKETIEILLPKTTDFISRMKILISNTNNK